MESEAFISTVMALIALLFVAAVSAWGLKRIRFPYTVGLVLLGVALAFVGENLPELSAGIASLKLAPVIILFVFIPTLIFESAFATDVRLLTKNLVPTLVLAAPGLLLSTGIIGYLVYWLTDLPLGSALIFGCLISATDPVAVIALFKDIGAPKRLNILVEGESLFNDATAIVTFQIILGVIATGILDTQTLTSGLFNFFGVFFGGLIVGLGIGYLLVLAIQLIGDEPLVHITLTLVVAYGAFIIAEHFLHTSGIMAVLGAGLVLGYYGHTLYTHRVREYLEIFWENAAFVANSLIFLMLGLSEKVFLTNVNSNIGGLLLPVLTVIAIVIVVRAAIVFGLTPLINRLPGQRAVDRRYQTIMWWGGLRGAVAVALAISLPSTFPFRWQIIDFAFGVTLFTLLVNGVTMPWLMRRVGFDKPSPLTDFTQSFVRVLAKQAALSRLDGQTASQHVDTAAIAQVRDAYQRDLAEAETHLGTLRATVQDSDELRQQLMWLWALGIQQEVYEQRYADGLISLDSLRELEWDLRAQEMAVEAWDSTGANLTMPEILQCNRFQPPTWLPRWRNRIMVQAYEEVVTYAHVARSVRTQLDEIRAFSGATDSELDGCLTYYRRVEDAALLRLQTLEQQFGDACADVKTRQLHKIAQDGEQDVVRGLTMTRTLPEMITDRLEQRLEIG